MDLANAISIFQFAECQLAECRLAECRFSECRFAKFRIVEYPLAAYRFHECWFAYCWIVQRRFAECWIAKWRFAEYSFAECRYKPNVESPNAHSLNDDPHYAPSPTTNSQYADSRKPILIMQIRWKLIRRMPIRQISTRRMSLCLIRNSKWPLFLMPYLIMNEQ